jgi:hypothetical protein
MYKIAFIKKHTRFLTLFLAVIIVLGISAGIVLAAAPSGDDTFQLITGTQTGSDNTGDGGTGDGDDLNYYYVGQQFTTTFRIKSGGTTAANIWVDYNNSTTTADNLSTGSYFNTWDGQTIDTSEATSFGGARVLSTGSNIPTAQSSGTGNFGTVRWTMVYPTVLSLSTSTPGLLDINIGSVGDTTESNISLSGVDLLDDEEDFEFHVWADTTKPYPESFSPGDSSTDVSISSNFTFNLRDSKNGEGDSSGVGTGMSTSEPPGVITFNGTSETDDSSFSCSGTWGTNLCAVTVNPDPPSGISGDSRNFEYNTAYTVAVSGFQDLASASQDQLGEANGPNTMNATSTSFTTESDTVKPQVESETPTRSTTNVATTTNITVEVEDRKTYSSGPSGTGITSSTCSINVSSPSQALITYEEGDAQVTVNSIDYGYQYVINPDSNFEESETVTVSVFACTDAASNVMTTDTYTFATTDATDPYVDEASPADDGTVDTDGTITFHIKDIGAGVSLSDTVIYVNGEYYTNDGGAVSVTTTGTSITNATSLDFNGSNYSGDTTSVSGTSADYTFVIDPETDFTAGESVPVLIYSQDSNSNLMEREVIGIVAQVDGSTYCGTNTSWSGSKCNSSVASSGGGGGGGGGVAVAQTGVSFSGRAYPLNRVDLLKDGVIVASTVAGPDARFSISITGINAGSHIFSVIGKDKDGLRSPPFSVPVTLTSGVTTNIGGLFLSPTLTVDKKIVKRGENIAIFGQTVPESKVTIGVASEHETFQTTDADKDGVFLYNFDTTPLEKGDHETRAKATKDNEISEFGRTVAFEVGNKTVLNTEEVCPAKGDLNSDCRVNLIDFSIAGFWYKKTLSGSIVSREFAVLNSDGVINLVDLSIMGFYWTG